MQDTTTNIQKSVVFYTNSELRGIEEITSFITISKGIKYLGINVTKEVKECTQKTIKQLMKETGEK